LYISKREHFIVTMLGDQTFPNDVGYDEWQKNDAISCCSEDITAQLQLRCDFNKKSNASFMQTSIVKFSLMLCKSKKISFITSKKWIFFHRFLDNKMSVKKAIFCSFMWFKIFLHNIRKTFIKLNLTNYFLILRVKYTALNIRMISNYGLQKIKIIFSLIWHMI
jgi:hypothetical protein